MRNRRALVLGGVLAALVLAAAFAFRAGWFQAEKTSDGPSLSPPKPRPAEEPRPGDTRILFLGNSFTYVNDLPHLLQEVAASKGRKIYVDSHSPGGYRLSQHVTDPETTKRLDQREWDFVVLQDQSQLPALDPRQVAKVSTPHALELDRMIHLRHPSTRTAFFETWGRRDGDAQNCSAIPEVCTYQGMQQRLDRSYESWSTTTKGILVPVGVAWEHVRSEHPEVDLYAPDGVHASLPGTYLAACVFLRSLLDTSPIGAAHPGLTDPEADILQRAADAATQSADH